MSEKETEFAQLVLSIATSTVLLFAASADLFEVFLQAKIL